MACKLIFTQITVTVNEDVTDEECDELVDAFESVDLKEIVKGALRDVADKLEKTFTVEVG